jgi:MFS family permease
MVRGWPTSQSNYDRPPMSELLTAAADALNIPEPLVQRSAAARATANGTSVDDVLSAWAGGAPAGGSAPPAEAPAPAEVETEAAAEETMAEAPAPAPEPAAQPEVMAPAAAVIVAEPEPEVVLEPVPLGRRIRTAIRVGAWTGAGLGLIGFVVASNWWAPTATVTGEETFTPVIQASSNGVIIGAALISVVFGAVIASLSRAAASWANPGMQLSSKPSATFWIGALIGVVLGLVAGALLSSLGTPVEGAEGAVQLPVPPTLAVMAIGGALLGGLTAALTQATGVPVAVADGDDSEIETVRKRLGWAFGVPLTGLLLLLLLVLPFAWTLIQSNHLTSGGAAIIGILTAAGILGFASLAGTKPNIKLSFGEVIVAVIGIGTIVVFILAVLFARSSEEEHDEPAAETEAAITFVVS